MGSDVVRRKADHIRIALEGDVEYRKSNWLEYVELVHRALPELSLESVDTTATFLGREFRMPLLIEGMTGGTEEAMRINEALARAASRLGIPMGVGSQRAGIVNREVRRTYTIAREVAPDAFLIANIGAAQLVKGGVEMAKEAVEMLDADALAVHLNVLQELVQPGGDTDFRGVADAIRRVTESLKVPVIVKEVGCGISYEDAVVLKEAGVRAIDVSGSGGTNWTEIERQRALAAGDLDKASLAEVFREWGIPTAAAVMEVSRVEGVEVVGSGGIRTGLEVVKVLTLGASMAGMARPFLSAAVEGPEAVMRLASKIERELRAAMVLTGSRRIADLRSAPRVILGPLKDWCEQRGVLR